MSSNIWLSEQELSEVSIGNGETKMVPKEPKVHIIDNFQDFNFRLHIQTFYVEFNLFSYLLPKLWKERTKIGHNISK